MGLLDRLVGLEEFDYISTPAVRERIDAGQVVELADGGLINVELALDLDPDAILTFAFGSPEYDNHPKLVEAGLLTVLSADYMETTPLGRSEWIKYTSLYFNSESAANRVFDGIAERYRAVAELAAQAPERPSVFTGGLWGGAWYVPGGQSYFARFLADAGANYLWADEGSSSSLPMDFELVYERAADADVWLPDMSGWRDRATMLAEDERYAEFAAFQSGAVYNNSARTNQFGGNDYYESGIANPDVVLSDLIAIFHPELLPDHELVYYEQLPPTAAQE
jgi:iron complex transport system substrate-binding protein